jgi:hypothetical protein
VAAQGVRDLVLVSRPGRRHHQQRHARGPRHHHGRTARHVRGGAVIRGSDADGAAALVDELAAELDDVARIGRFVPAPAVVVIEGRVVRIWLRPVFTERTINPCNRVSP